MLHFLISERTLKDRVKNTEIRKQSQVQDNKKDLVIQTFGGAIWAGHIARRDDNRLTKRLTEWQPRIGKRWRGRQKRK